jgi:hypothetical protein
MKYSIHAIARTFFALFAAAALLGVGGIACANEPELVDDDDGLFEMLDADGDELLDEEEFSGANNAFDMLDRNDDGLLDDEEFDEDDEFGLFDADDDGSIDSDEFDEAFEDDFDALDANDDGVLDDDEFELDDDD